MRAAIGIDLGGTNIKAALIDTENGSVVSMQSRPTRDGEFENDVPRFALTVREVVRELEAEAGQGELAVGLSAPGLAEPAGTCIRWMPGRMHGLESLKWTDQLERTVQVLNDAHAALLGEVWVGAARGCQDVFMLTLGTGVGGAVFSGGRLLKGNIGRAGHLGHISLDAGAPLDDFGTPGSLEAAMGNQSIGTRGGDRYANTLQLIEKVTMGDAEARQIWLESVRALSVGIASLINVLDPEKVIIGGGIAVGAGARLFEPLSGYLDQFEWRPGGHRVEIVPAQAGDLAGCFGAVWNLLKES
jgi:glucokinase